MLCFVIMHLGAFCIENAPTLSVAVVIVLVATGHSQLQSGRFELQPGLCELQPVRIQLQPDRSELQLVRIQLQ
jgi:hypothetical protein